MGMPRSREDLEGEMVQANEAQHLLNHHLIKGAFEYMERTYTEALLNGRDEDKRMLCLRLLDAGRLWKSHFENILTTGRLADNEIANLVRTERARKKYG